MRPHENSDYKWDHQGKRTDQIGCLVPIILFVILFTFL